MYEQPLDPYGYKSDVQRVMVNMVTVNHSANLLVKSLREKPDTTAESELSALRQNKLLSDSIKDKIDATFAVLHPDDPQNAIRFLKRADNPDMNPQLLADTIQRLRAQDKTRVYKNAEAAGCAEDLAMGLAERLHVHVEQGHWTYGAAEKAIKTLNSNAEETDYLRTRNDNAKRVRVARSIDQFGNNLEYIAVKVLTVFVPEENAHKAESDIRQAVNSQVHGGFIKTVTELGLTVRDTVGSLITHVTPTGVDYQKRRGMRV